MMFYVKHRIGRALVCPLGLLIVCGLYLLSPWDLVWVQKRLNPIKLIEDIRNDQARRGFYYNDYIRDRSGYLYPEGYFEFAPSGVAPSFKDMDFRGRHSDEVMPACKKFPGGAGREIEYVFDYKIPRFNFSKEYKNPCWFEKDEKGEKKLVCMPYFYFIGTPKAGSSDLYYRLTGHPDVTHCAGKERRFFDRERFKKPQWYSFRHYLATYYPAAQIIFQRNQNGSKYNKVIFGDGSPTYMYNNVRWYRFPGNEGCLEPRITCVSYIHYINPGAKLILIVRNPVDRLYSSYLYNWKRTGALRTPEQFHEWATKAVNAHVQCFKEEPFRACLYSEDIINKTILTVSANIYSRLVMDVLKIFPREQLHVVHLEEYSKNITVHLPEVYDFLGLDPLPQNRLETISNKDERNKGREYDYAGPMLLKTRKMLYHFYKPFNRELAYILKDDKYLWHEDL